MMLHSPASRVLFAIFMAAGPVAQGQFVDVSTGESSGGGSAAGSKKAKPEQTAEEREELEEALKSLVEARRAAREKAAEEAEKAEAGKPPPKKTISSAVNVIRPSGSRLEVMFRNGESYPLPRSNGQAAMVRALEESERTGAAVSVTVDERTGLIEAVSLPKAAEDSKASGK